MLVFCARRGILKAVKAVHGWQLDRLLRAAFVCCAVALNLLRKLYMLLNCSQTQKKIDATFRFQQQQTIVLEKLMLDTVTAE